MPNSRWEDNVYGKVTKKDWIDIGSQVPTRQNDPIDSLFGDVKTDNIVAEWESLASEYGIPMMAQFHGFDTEAQKTFRVPIDTHNIEKGLIKVKLNQSERLRALTRAGVQGDDRLYEYVMNDGIRLADQVVTRSKVAKNELLATGKITIKENNLDLTVDYGVSADQLASSNEVDVTQASADPMEDIQTIIDKATSKGVVITGMVTSKKVLSKLRKNSALQKAINGNIGAGALIQNSALKAFFSDEFGINQIITNDLTYGSDFTMDSNDRPVITTKRYFPEDKISFFGTNVGGKLGTGLWGDSPEVDVAEFMKGSNSEITPYVFITQWAENDPAVLWTKASALFIPVLYNPNSLFVANVKDTGV